MNREVELRITGDAEFVAHGFPRDLLADLYPRGPRQQGD
jgi:hypothetical protein